MSDEWIIVDRALYLTEDGARVVKEGDVRGRWLHWPPGTRVRKTEYDRLVKVEVINLPATKPKSPQRRK